MGSLGRIFSLFGFLIFTPGFVFSATEYWVGHGNQSWILKHEKELNELFSKSQLEVIRSTTTPWRPWKPWWPLRKRGETWLISFDPAEDGDLTASLQKLEFKKVKELNVKLELARYSYMSDIDVLSHPMVLRSDEIIIKELASNPEKLKQLLIDSILKPFHLFQATNETTYRWVASKLYTVPKEVHLKVAAYTQIASIFEDGSSSNDLIYAEGTGSGFLPTMPTYARVSFYTPDQLAGCDSKVAEVGAGSAATAK